MDNKMQVAGRQQTMAWARWAAWTVCMTVGVTAGAQMTPTGYHLTAMPAAAGVGAGQASQPQPEVKDDLFTGTEVFAKGASDVTEITMDPETLDLVGGRDSKRAHNMILNVVRTYSYDKPGMYNMADVDRFREKLNTGEWHCSVHVRDLKTGESTDVCNKQRSDGLAETAIITVEPKSLTFIHTIRRKSGEGEFKGLGLMYSLPGLPTLAMIDPDAFVDMQMATARLHSLDSGAMQLRLDKAMKLQLNSAEMKLKMDDAMKQMKELNTPEMKLKMDDAMKQLKDMQMNLKLNLELPKPDSATPKSDQPKEPE